MSIYVSEKQLDQMESGRTPVVIVKSKRTKKRYALIPERLYSQLRPLLQSVSMRVDAQARHEEGDRAIEWTTEMNARRVALIHKKYEQGLTPTEKKELNELMAEAERFCDRTAAVHNDILELILAGLQSFQPKPAKR